MEQTSSITKSTRAQKFSIKQKKGGKTSCPNSYYCAVYCTHICILVGNNLLVLQEHAERFSGSEKNISVITKLVSTNDFVDSGSVKN